MACGRTSPRRLLAARQRCSANKDRDNPHIAAQCGLDFKAHKVLGVVEPPMAGPVGDVEPAVTDEGEQHLAGANCVLDDPEKVVARVDGVDVFENVVTTETGAQAVIQPTRRKRRVLPTVADKDPPRVRRGGRPHTVKNATRRPSTATKLPGRFRLITAGCMLGFPSMLVVEVLSQAEVISQFGLAGSPCFRY